MNNCTPYHMQLHLWSTPLELKPHGLRCGQGLACGTLECGILPLGHLGLNFCPMHAQPSLSTHLAHYGTLDTVASVSRNRKDKGQYQTLHGDMWPYSQTRWEVALQGGGQHGRPPQSPSPSLVAVPRRNLGG